MFEGMRLRPQPMKTFKTGCLMRPIHSTSTQAEKYFIKKNPGFWLHSCTPFFDYTTALKKFYVIDIKDIKPKN